MPWHCKLGRRGELRRSGSDSGARLANSKRDTILATTAGGDSSHALAWNSTKLVRAPVLVLSAESPGVADRVRRVRFDRSCPISIERLITEFPSLPIDVVVNPQQHASNQHALAGTPRCAGGGRQQHLRWT
jgi:hypothetical protein